MSSDAGSTANPGYALGQLQRALAALVGHPDPAVRARAAAKADGWRAVLAGMRSGELVIGSRTPVRDTPAWVTLEVAHGGFATGRLSAEQPLDDDERARLADLPPLPGHSDRQRLNLWFLSDDGQALLLAALEQDRCVVELPEHAAIPTVVLLLARGHQEQALDLVAQLWPFVHRLRLTPRLVDAPQPLQPLVHVQPVGAVREQLQRTTTPLQVRAMQSTLSTWNPLHDELLALWAQTVDGDLPRRLEAAGASQVAGGWPCQRFPADWPARRRALLDRYALAADRADTPTRHLHRRSSTRRLVDALEACPADSTALSPRDVGWIRRVLADGLAAAGDLDGEQRTSLRAQQAQHAARPTRRDLARVLEARLAPLPAEGGLTDLDRAVAPVTPDELPALTAPQPVPTSLRRKVARALEAPVAELVDRGVIPSGDVLARVLPQITAQHVASGIADPVAAGLYARTYAAFRRRRSLLLLDLQHQVGLAELPWVAALEVFAGRTEASTAAAADALREVVLLALDAFPHAVLPNPLVRELGALARRAEVPLLLVEEVAADIFQGTFTPKWRAAAALASRTLDGTLYARYYDLPPAGAWQDVPDQRRGLRRRLRTRWTKETAEDFAEACRTRAREAGGPGGAWDVAGNGTVLEQSQVLTTQNLAVLVDGLGLQARLQDLAPSLVERVFDWIVRSWQHLPREDHGRLLTVKGVAYAWRQAMFLLSAVPVAEQRRLTAELAERVGREAPALEPVVQGLEHVLEGGRFDEHGQALQGQGRRLLGWSVGPHWLLPPALAPARS